MMGLIKNISSFLLLHPVWMFLTGLLFIDYILMVESEEYSWPFYLINFAVLIGIFFPTLLYISIRPFIIDKWSPLIRQIAWGLTFLAYPFFLYFFPIDFGQIPKLVVNQTSGIVRLNQLVLLIATGFLLLEGYLKTQSFWQGANRKATGFLGKNLERYLLILIGVLSVFLGGLEVFGNLEGLHFFEPKTWLPFIPSWLSVSLQYALIGLVYYCFYYLNHYFLIPQILKKKGIVFYGFGVVATILVFYPLLFQIISWLPVLQEDLFGGPTGKRQIIPEDRGGLPFLIMVLSVPVIILIEWYRQSNELAELEREKVSTELNLLKQQINPHFFFNTLNNLYALSLKQDKNTPEVILQLAELMRYVIYRGQESTVTLEDEIQYLEDYIRLQQLRLHKKLDLQFEKDIADPMLKVPPLLFIILVENAFKHGVEPAEKDCQLSIQLNTSESRLEFYCENSVEELSDRPDGIGLQNLRRRLNLLFPEKHNLVIEDLGNRFSAKLIIDL